jgi:hypothetical protein
MAFFYICNTGNHQNFCILAYYLLHKEYILHDNVYKAKNNASYMHSDHCCYPILIYNSDI